jgi:hypothetical protein
MENMKNLESEIKGKLENAFDVSHLYTIFASLVSAISEQSEEITNLKRELNTTQSLCRNLAENMKMIEYNIQGFDLNDEIDPPPELKIRNILEVDPSKGVRHSLQNLSSKDSRPPTAQKRKESKSGEKTPISPPPSRRPSRSSVAEARVSEKSKSPTNTEMISPVLSRSSGNLERPNARQLDTELSDIEQSKSEQENVEQPLPLIEMISPNESPELPYHRPSQLCGITPKRTQEQEMAWKQKKMRILQLMYARMTFLIAITSAANISCT